ncbi:MAG: hypothetical protein ABII90_15735 [Bacteroidota bacterium]
MIRINDRLSVRQPGRRRDVFEDEKIMYGGTPKRKKSIEPAWYDNWC